MKKILMYFGSLIFIFQSIGLNTAIANDDLIQTNFSMAPSYSAPGMSLNQVAAAIARENGGVGNIASLAQSRGDIQVTNLPAANGGQQLAASQGLRGAILEIISTLLGNSVGNIASPTQSRGDTQVTNLPARNNDPSNTGLKVVRSPLAPNEAGAGRAGDARIVNLPARNDDQPDARLKVIPFR